MNNDIFSPEMHQEYPLMIVISGPSGIGKDTVVRLLEQRNQSFCFVVTATSRAPRPGEIEGIDYQFVTRERFEEMIVRDELIEYAKVYSDYKGIPRKSIEDALNCNQDIILRLDVQGARKIRELFPDAVLVFLIPENDRMWIERLSNRNTESSSKLQERLQAAREELHSFSLFDYVVVNATGKLNETIDCILSIVHAEHHRIKHRRVSL